MCFSLQADLTVGVALLPVAAVSLREVRCLRELPFAALPLLFAAHQLTEALVWPAAADHVAVEVQQVAASVYVFYALSILPLLIPLAVLLLEPRRARRRVAPFVALGAVVAVYLAVEVIGGPLTFREGNRALVYGVGLDHAIVWTVLYVTAVIGPSLLSGYPSIVVFGLLNLIGLVAVAISYREALASLWCIYAAATSILVMVHMVLRRRLPDHHRLHGHEVIAA